MKILKQNLAKEIRIVSWKVKESEFVSANRVAFVYSVDLNGNTCQKKYKIASSGTVKRLFVAENVQVLFGAPLIELDECTHATVIIDMCANCGADLRNVNEKSTASVPMIHSVPELKVSVDIAKKIGASETEQLLKNRKLVLLVDLDQTLIHTTNYDVNPHLKDVHHFQLYGDRSPWYHTRLRPGTHQFLDNITKIYELHICTFGARDYAHRIAQFLDPNRRLFFDRILSRDECFDPTSKTANLTSLFPCGDNLVCIIDDREDVWCYARNLIHVKPYVFFQNTGDINAPKQSESMPEIIESKVKENENNNVVVVVNDNDNNKEEFKSEVCKKEESLIEEVEDNDDYLLYLEDILKKVHGEFYCNYKENFVPDLKEIIPQVRNQVLKGCKLVFSGLVPKNLRLDASRPYKIARDLGAEVAEILQMDCTHLIAVKPGTEKVNMVSKYPDVKVVTPSWLWMCAERWEKVEEKLFPLNHEVKRFTPPPHCSPERNDGKHESVKRKRDVKFIDTINPLMSLSSADIEDMDREVQDIFNNESETDSSSDEDQQRRKIARKQISNNSSESSSSSDEDSYSTESVTGCQDEQNNEHNGSESDNELSHMATDDEEGVDSKDNEDDDDLNRMGEELERGFLSE